MDEGWAGGVTLQHGNAPIVTQTGFCNALPHKSHARIIVVILLM